MHTLKIKPLSVNQAWKGKRFKTDLYKAYEKELFHILPKKDINPKAKLAIHIEFGFSNSGSDIDNPVKPFFDVLQKKYGIDDKSIHFHSVQKIVVKKGQEYIKFSILEYKRSVMDRIINIIFSSLRHRLF